MTEQYEREYIDVKDAIVGDVLVLSGVEIPRRERHPPRVWSLPLQLRC